MKKYKLISTDTVARDKTDYNKLYHILMDITNTPTSESGFDSWFDDLVREGVILEVEVEDDRL